MESAKAEGEKIRLIGGAEARAVEAVGRAEAERMRMKASAYKQYGDAAILSLVLEALPQVSLTDGQKLGDKLLTRKLSLLSEKEGQELLTLQPLSIYKHKRCHLLSLCQMILD